MILEEFPIMLSLKLMSARVQDMAAKSNVLGSLEHYVHGNTLPDVHNNKRHRVKVLNDLW